MDDAMRLRLTAWLHGVEEFLSRNGVTVDELRALWEEVTPPPPDQTGTPLLRAIRRRLTRWP